MLNAENRQIILLDWLSLMGILLLLIEDPLVNFVPIETCSIDRLFLLVFANRCIEVCKYFEQNLNLLIRFFGAIEAGPSSTLMGFKDCLKNCFLEAFVLIQLMILLVRIKLTKSIKTPAKKLTIIPKFY